jgi:GalNAc-alpha-(1->4)-GalNAc-alpha-(1->3)-diNAcBac-PP-undecaprenol alpha-1,4-N-acetyl-D-galactosaminyltransferase
MSMTILLVVDHFGRGGAQRQIANLGPALSALGHEVEYFVYYPHDAFRPTVDQAGIRVWESSKSRRYDLKVVGDLRRRLSSGRYDVALSYLDTPNVYLELASLGQPTTAIVVSERSQFPSGRLSPAVRLREQLHRVADHIVVNSTGHGERLVREFPWMADRLSVIMNGVDPDFFRVSAVRQPGQTVRLLAVGTVVPIKNALGLVQALAQCRNSGRDVHVAWAGRHPDTAADHRQMVDRTIDELDLRDRWRWLGERADVASLLGQHDALIHPSVHEGLPNALCEALAAGRPVLAGTIADHPRLVEDGVSGYLFDPREPASMAAAIARFAGRSPADRASMGERARDVALQRLTMDRCAGEYEAVFRRVVDSRRRRPVGARKRDQTYIVGRIPPPYGGVSVFVGRRIEQLKREGAAPVHLDPHRPLRLLAGLFRSRLRGGKIEVNSLSTGALLLLASTGNLGRTIVYDHNHSRLFRDLSRTRQKLLGHLLRRVRTVRLVGDHLRPHYNGRWIRLPQSVEVVSPFLPPPKHTESDIVAAYPMFLRTFIDARRPLLVSSIWRFLPPPAEDVYGVHLCLALVQRLKDRFPSLGLVLALGDSTPAGGASDLAREVEGSGLNDRVLVMAGHGELWPITRRADVFIRATSTDGASVSVLEALGLGCPVAATNVVPRPDGVRLFEHGDLDGLEQAVLDALSAGAAYP